MQTITIVVPCFNEQESIPRFYSQICALRDRLPQIRLELLFVDDGSKDQTLPLLRELQRTDACVNYLSFSRNFGKEAAMLAGLEYAGGDAVIVMDADLQDPPELIPQMIGEWYMGYDTVFARRTGRGNEPPVRSMLARLYYRIANRFVGVPIVDGARDFRIMDRKVVDSILSMKERLRFSKGLFSWVGFRSKCIEYQYAARSCGKTNWSFSKLFNYAVEGIVSFSYAPLRLASFVGVTIAVFAFMYMLFIVISSLVTKNPVSGYPSLITLILFIGGIQLLFLGVIGEYVGKIFEEVKQRPHYIIKESEVNRHSDKL